MSIKSKLLYTKFNILNSSLLFTLNLKKNNTSIILVRTRPRYSLVVYEDVKQPKITKK